MSTVTKSELAIAEGGRSTNSSSKLLGFSTMPTTCRVHAVEIDRRADLGVERVGDPVGHRRFVVGGRIATRSQIEQRSRRMGRPGCCDR